ncbi:MAG: GWxTD domain-containing protein [Bacteroidetes bacterium]|nr:GWxTD domain-containing protein [Bacteroidota bacterium]
MIISSLCAQEAEIAQIFTEENISLYGEASTKYLEWIAQAADPNAGDSEDLKKHLRWIALITPEQLQVNKSSRLLIAGQGSFEDANRIVSWWRQQDPLPATFDNERIEEHLYRVYYAERNYAYNKDSLGVDDRGRIFVRFGKPWRETVISLLNPRLQILPIEYRLPRNELWVYRGIHDDAHFLFVQTSRRRPYRVTTSESLIPSNLRGTRRRVEVLLAWMEDIFGQMAMQHDHYGTVYDAVSNYTALPTSAPLRPYEFSQRTIMDSRMRDDQHQKRREETIPTSTTRVYGNAIELKPQVRFSRFLQEDGSTRLETYWNLDVRDLRPSRSMLRRTRQLGQKASDDYILSIGFAHRDSEFEPRNIQIRRYHLPEGSDTEPRVYSWVTSDLSSPSSMALQWTLHWTVPDSIPPQPSTIWGIGVMNLDGIDILRSDDDSLELSDLKPLLLESANTFDGATPLVDREIYSGIPLGLYFESYFLRFNETDRTNYTIEYSLSGENKEPITTSFEYEGYTATIREYISIDIDQWDTPGPFVLTLTVTDLITGISVSRSIDLDYVK